MANDVAYGFTDLAHLFSQKVTSEQAPTIQRAVEESFLMHNRMVSAMLDGLVIPTTEYKINFQLADAGEAQPLDEKGNPVVQKPEGTYEVAFPIKSWGHAYGLTELSQAHATMEDMNRFTLTAMTKDLRRMMRHILASWFTNTTYIYKDEGHGNLTIQPLANGDAVTYTKVDGEKATADHFSAINSVINDGNNPFEAIYELLTTYPSNAGPYVAYIPTNLVSATKALTGFYEPDNPNVNYGDDTDLANATVDPDNPVVNSGVVGFGNRLIGYVDDVWVIHSRILPSNYVLGHARGADMPFGMREYTPTSLRGIRYSSFSPDGNEVQYRSKRSAGFGARNRLGACVVQMSAASYAIPAGYNAGTEVN